MASTFTIDNRGVCQIAAAADTDHRTVRNFLAGIEPRRGGETRARKRIREVMLRMGLADHIPLQPGLAKV